MRVPKPLMAACAAGVVALATCGPAAAQVKPPRPNAPVIRHPLLGRLAFVLSRLDLSPEQKTQVKGFVQTAQTKVQAVRQNAALTPAQRRAELQAIAKSLRASILGILSPDQKARLRRLMAAGPVPNPIMRRWAMLLSRLNLSPAQKTQIRGFVKDTAERARAVRQSSVAPRQKRLQLAALQKSLRESILGVLTPAQKAKLQAMLKNGAQRRA